MVSPLANALHRCGTSHLRQVVERQRVQLLQLGEAAATLLGVVRLLVALGSQRTEQVRQIHRLSGEVRGQH